jgi:hypothetical protein
MYHDRKVRGHVYVLGNINMYHARKVRGDVYVPCREREESGICTMPGK